MGHTGHAGQVVGVIHGLEEDGSGTLSMTDTFNEASAVSRDIGFQQHIATTGEGEGARSSGWEPNRGGVNWPGMFFCSAICPARCFVLRFYLK